MAEDSKAFLSIEPDPNILQILAHTPLKPIDALCELIDNALDSFDAARRQGVRIDHRWIRIVIPRAGQIERGEGVIRVVDNGVGLDAEGLGNALTAGFSSKSKFNALGLFGVGFNIATAKLGRKTVVTTARAEPDGSSPKKALRATIDLPNMRSFRIPLEELMAVERGTVVEVSDWWPNGTPNDRFALELAKISKPKLLEQLGRRYGTILRDPDKQVNMTVNDETVIPFEHCVWSESRFVNRKGIGNIPAKIVFDETLKTLRRCETDANIIQEGETSCSACGGTKIVQLHERVRGWIGVQRFDDKSNFGIDLIRNGRAIRVAEKDAFFNFTNDLGETEKEYPIDQNTGRIVGEVHLDHVPVDYTKQDFARTSREWQDAIRYLRGHGLQAKNRAPDETGRIPRNESPVGKIFDGYRKVRSFGREDMYPGIWAETRSERISRETELEYYKRFKAREAGFYDDAEWWKLVEEATIPVLKPLVSCPNCFAQNPESAIDCIGCGDILKAKSCVSCQAKIRVDADECLKCGATQRIVVSVPWTCVSCSYLNGPDDVTCAQCRLAKGSADPMSVEELRKGAVKIDDLSFESQVFRRLDGTPTEAISVSTYAVAKDRLKAIYDQPPLPSFVPPSQSLDRLEIFLDRQHPLFTELGYAPEFAVSSHVAGFLQALIGAPWAATLNFTGRILQSAFGDRVSTTRESVRREVEELIGVIVELVRECEWVAELSDEMSAKEREVVAQRLYQIGQLEKFEAIQRTGGFLTYVPNVILRSYRQEPGRWEGEVFVKEAAALGEVAPTLAGQAAEQSRRATLRAMEECFDFLDSPTSDEFIVRRVKSSVSYLLTRVV